MATRSLGEILLASSLGSVLDVLYVTMQCGSRVMVREPQYEKSDFPFILVVDESCATKSYRYRETFGRIFFRFGEAAKNPILIRFKQTSERS